MLLIILIIEINHWNWFHLDPWQSVILTRNVGKDLLWLFNDDNDDDDKDDDSADDDDHDYNHNDNNDDNDTDTGNESDDDDDDDSSDDKDDDDDTDDDHDHDGYMRMSVVYYHFTEVVSGGKLRVKTKRRWFGRGEIDWYYNMNL